MPLQRTHNAHSMQALVSGAGVNESGARAGMFVVILVLRVRSRVVALRGSGAVSSGPVTL